MKIVLAEPLGVDQKIVDRFAEELSDMGHTFTIYDTVPSGQQELAGRIQDADAVMIANYPFREAAIRSDAALKYINIAFTGVDHVDIPVCKQLGIHASNASGYSDIAVSELAFSMMLALSRNLPQCDAAVRNGKTKAGLIGTELYGKTLGVIGAGKIGSAVIKIALAFGCKVIAYSRTVKPELELLGVEFVSLQELMRQSDIVSLHLPQNDTTKGMINAELIGLMKPTAIFINTARGPIVDSQALADALNAGKIAGAGIDVFENEPPIQSDHPLVTAKNTLLTPHVAFATKEALERRAAIVFENTFAWLHGEIKNQIC